MALKKKLFLVILICPTILFNYWTLKYLDLDNNLSIFTTIIILVFNFVNILIGYIYYKYNFKILFSFTLYLFIIFIISDLSLEKILNKKSIIENDKLLGWTIKPKMDIIFNQETFKRTKYIVNYKSSSERDFREFGNLNSNSKKILVLGDSYTGGPYASNEKMYYNVIKNIFKKNDIKLEWFVMGTGGYGTVQHYLLLEKYFKIIRPEIILHQFCTNDFFDNSINIGKLSTSPNQYYRRPYFINGKITKVNTSYAKIYRFLYNYSFIFKKLDQIYNYKQFRLHGRFLKEIPNEFILKSVNNTQVLFSRIRELVGEDTLYFSTNCADDTYNYLSDKWENIINNINGFAIVKPGKKLIELKNAGYDVYHEDGGHINEVGNKIYGEITAEEILKVIKNEKY
jgi:lysophospholipase L1-like esterase